MIRDPLRIRGANAATDALRRLAAQDALIQAIQGLAPWVSKAGESGAFEGCARPDGWRIAIENAVEAVRKADPEALP